MEPQIVINITDILFLYTTVFRSNGQVLIAPLRKLCFQHFRCRWFGEQLSLGIIAGRQVVIGMGRSGKAVDAAMFAAAVGVDRAFEADVGRIVAGDDRSEEHTSELQSLMRISYAVFCLKKKNKIYIAI